MVNVIRIDNTEITPEIDVYIQARTDSQLLHYNEPEPGLFVAESPLVIGRALDAGYEPVSLLAEEKHLAGEAREIIARCGDIPVYTASFEELKRLLGYPMLRGCLCAMRRHALPSEEEVCAGARRVAVLEDVENPTNVGAIFRSAAALGMDAVLLTATCSDPLYRRATRTSMGTVFQVPWTFLEEKRSGRRGARPKAAEREDASGRSSGKDAAGSGCSASALPGDHSKNCAEQLRELGFATAAMALAEDTVAIDDPALQKEEKLAVILGAEGTGLAQETIDACDHKVMIPMAHGVDSLNVAAASAVAFWELRAR